MSHYGTGYSASDTDGSGSGYGSDTAYKSRDSRADYASTSGYSTVASYGVSRGGAPVVSFENVSKYYGRLKAVDGLTLDLRSGETTALLGPNGAGKSTSLDMLLALRKPTSGKIQMFGRPRTRTRE